MLEPSLLKHLNDNEVVPELHLTRWLRCVMSREYCIESTVIVWDFVFSGVSMSKIDLANPFESEVDRLFRPPSSDPFINLEFISCAMVVLLKEELMEYDFSMCLGTLMSYKEPKDLISVINKATVIRAAILEEKEYTRMPSPVPEPVEEENYLRPRQEADYSMEPQLNAPHSSDIITASHVRSHHNYAYDQDDDSANASKTYQRLQHTAEVLNPYLQTAGQSALKAKNLAKENVTHYMSPLGGIISNVASKAASKAQEVGAVAAQKYQERYAG